MIQCRDGTQDQRNINAILELAAGVDVEANKKESEEGVAKEGGEPSAKKRRREVKNAVRGSGQYVYDEEGVRSVQFEIKTALKQRSSEQSYEYDLSKSGTLTALPACLMSVIHIPGSFRSQSFLLQILFSSSNFQVVQCCSYSGLQ